ncbi:hypothetical protein C8R47DRAFT_1231441 [Mycena vitilis]|nr:hypothetical protein C8R47DRAFT_1231441 [Mycena vitilis]
MRRLKLAEDAIKKYVSRAKIRSVILDLSSLSSVRKAAAEVNSHVEQLHILIHNAAAPIASFELTVDKVEKQMATDHIGPFLLTKLLAPQILAARTVHFIPRVISRPDPALYDAMEAYYQAKAANVLTAIELSRRAKGQINAYSLDPGLYTKLLQTEQAIASLHKSGILTTEGQPDASHRFKTIAQGAATTLVAALDPALNDTPGAYLSNCVVANELIAPHSAIPSLVEDRR